MWSQLALSHLHWFGHIYNEGDVYLAEVDSMVLGLLNIGLEKFG